MTHGLGAPAHRAGAKPVQGTITLAAIRLWLRPPAEPELTGP
ncbi:hypothetical protein [Streptomyces syringium]